MGDQGVAGLEPGALDGAGIAGMVMELGEKKGWGGGGGLSVRVSPGIDLKLHVYSWCCLILHGSIDVWFTHAPPPQLAFVHT